MSGEEIIYSLLLNLIPLGLFALPMIFLYKKVFGKFYQKIFYGLSLFFLVYWVLPSVFQLDVQPLNSSSNGASIGILYLLAKSISMLMLYAQYPFVVLPFIFIASPIFSILLLSKQINQERENGSIQNRKEGYKALNYEYSGTPRELILNALKTDDWTQEKEMFKGFLILLPISLYLLTVILDIARVEESDISSLSGSSTAMGWFLEILFVYIATFLYGFEVLRASKVSLKGRFFGEQIQNRFYSSLKQVGTPIAVLSILLFIAQRMNSILLILFFFAYFLMAAFIFITFIRIFQPISVLLFIKLLNWKKERELKEKTKKRANITMDFIYAVLSSFVVLIVMLIFGTIMGLLIQTVPDGKNFLTLGEAGNQISLDMALLIDQLSAINSLQTILVTLCLAYFLVKTQELTSKTGLSFLVYTGTLLLITIILSFTGMFYYNVPLSIVGDEAWTTGSPVVIYVFGFPFFTMRTAFLTADLSSYIVLQVLAAPFLFFRPIVNYTLWGFLIFFFNKRFRTRTFHKEENLVERITFSDFSEIPSISTMKNMNNILITAENVVFTKKIDDALMEIYQYIKDNNGRLIEQLRERFADKFIIQKSQNKESNDKENSIERNISKEKNLTSEDIFYDALQYLTRKNYITWWIPEFSYVFEKATLDGLYILYTDGRDLVYYNFHKDQKTRVDPALVSGMFSAITSFIRETTKSSDLLRAIDSGDKKVLLEYSKDFPVFIALFADRETTEVRMALRDCLNKFIERHKKILNKWNGSMEYFEDDYKLVEEIFGDFI